MNDGHDRTVAREASGELVQLARHSIATLLAGQEPRGAFVAGPTFPNYRHAWLRDGSFCALAMSAAGHHGSAERFFGWAARAVTGQAARIRRFVSMPPAIPRGQDYPPARYSLAGERLDDGWWDWQHDGYGTWLWVMAEHQRRHGRLPEGVEPGVELTVEYLLHAWTLPCFDWWEENDGHLHVATLGAVAAGLAAAAEWSFLPAPLRTRARQAASEIRYAVATRGVRDGRLVKWLDDGMDVDASLLACMTPFGLFHPGEPVPLSTLAEIERRLVINGGVHRHPRDTFYGGGAWPLLSGLLGMHYVALGRVEDARRQLTWIAAQASPAGDLPEQVRHYLLAPDFLGEWLARWGEPACPLLWSHAMYLLLGLRLEVFGPADLGGSPPG
jgi:GH15 family glucan-1,4-alpha-glucosidase